MKAPGWLEFLVYVAWVRLLLRNSSRVRGIGELLWLLLIGHRLLSVLPFA